MRTTFIGGGVMAEAILGRAIAGQVLAAADVCVAEPIPDRRAYLSDTYGVAVSGDNAAAVDGAGMVVLSVKPQHFAAAADPLKGKLGGERYCKLLAERVPACCWVLLWARCPSRPLLRNAPRLQRRSPSSRSAVTPTSFSKTFSNPTTSTGNLQILASMS